MVEPMAEPAKRSIVRRVWDRITAGGWLLLIFTVVLPLLALATEAATRMCASTFLDPMPTEWHLAAVAFVPAANLLVWLSARSAWPTMRMLAPVLNGLALGISLFFALQLLPISLLGACVLVAASWYFGVGLLGLLPLAPLLAFVGGFFLRRRLLRAYTGQPRGRLRGLRNGLALAGLVVILLAGSDAVTIVGLHLASSDDSRTQVQGIQMLRRFGRTDLLLKACEWRGRDNFMEGLEPHFLPDPERLPAERGRTIFYRVTGQDYSLFRENPWDAPLMGRGRNRPEALTWDTDQGGSRIGGILKGLELYGSRYEHVLDENAGLAYAEWTLTFRNEFNAEREARARFVLPPGAVVTRLTLWINGEEREAAFGGRSQTREAYQRVVERRRDPVLVNTCGPDRIQLQCFPVPANGGEMKVRMGITLPLRVAADGCAATVAAPSIIERNFRVPAEITLPVARSVRLGKPLPSAAWAADKRGDPAGIVQQTVSSGPAWKPRRILLLVDGSRGMDAHLAAVANALTNLPPDLEAAVRFVGDAPGAAAEVRLHAPVTEARARELATRIGSGACAGGRCNLRALTQAWDDLASDSEASAIIWVHGPQPHPTTSADDFRQRLERAQGQVRLYVEQVLPGPCQITESLDGIAGVHSLPPVSGPGDTGRLLGDLLRSWNGSGTEWQFDRRRVEGASAGTGAEAGEHLVWMWAREDVQRLLSGGKPTGIESARALAVRYHVVTPVSGAVVLQTKQQYQEAGLEPVAAESVPTVPEPAFWITALLAVLALVVLAGTRRSGTIRKILRTCAKQST